MAIIESLGVFTHDQAQAEIKRGSNIAAPLVYLDKAVEACDDETALNARSG